MAMNACMQIIEPGRTVRGCGREGDVLGEEGARKATAMEEGAMLLAPWAKFGVQPSSSAH